MHSLQNRRQGVPRLAHALMACVGSFCEIVLDLLAALFNTEPMMLQEESWGRPEDPREFPGARECNCLSVRARASRRLRITWAANDFDRLSHTSAYRRRQAVSAL